MTRRSITAAFAFVALAAIQGFALRAQEPQAYHTPEGAWLVRGTFGADAPTFLWFDTYTSHSTSQGRAGTVLCTLPSATMTESGHGVWTRIQKNQFAITAWRITLRPDGQPAGLAKFWGTVTLSTNDTMTGTLNAEFFNLEGQLVNRMLGGKSAGTRIQIQYE